MNASTHIGAKAAQTNYYAEVQARRLGLPFTHMVTINYSLTKIDPRLAVAAFARLGSPSSWSRFRLSPYVRLCF